MHSSSSLTRRERLSINALNVLGSAFCGFICLKIAANLLQEHPPRIMGAAIWASMAALFLAASWKKK